MKEERKTKGKKKGSLGLDDGRCLHNGLLLWVWQWHGCRSGDDRSWNLGKFLIGPGNDCHLVDSLLVAWAVSTKEIFFSFFSR